MKKNRRPVVQLTSLLDLLFIMIFVAMMTTGKSDSNVKEASKKAIQDLQKQVAKSDAKNKSLAGKVNDLKNELGKAKARLLLAKAEDSKKGCPEAKTGNAACSNTKGDGNGYYRRLFVTNMYYKRSGRYRYYTSKIYSADNVTGIYAWRINLTGAPVVQSGGKPLKPDEVGTIKQCSKVVITRDKIAEDCNLIFNRHSKVDCKRISDREYQCDHILTMTNKQGKEKMHTWDYKLELIHIYDPALK